MPPPSAGAPGSTLPSRSTVPVPWVEIRLALERPWLEREVVIGEGVPEPRAVPGAAEPVAQAAERTVDQRVGLPVILLQNLLPTPRRRLDERRHVRRERLLG